MRRRQYKKNYKKIITGVQPTLDALTAMGWFFCEVGKEVPVTRNGNRISDITLRSAQSVGGA